MAKRNEKLETALNNIIPTSFLAGGEEDKQEIKPVIQQASNMASGIVKATYYVGRDLVKRLKYVSADTDRDLSNLVNEAIADLLIKFNR